MMNRNKSGGLWLGMALVAGTWAAGCGTNSSESSAVTQDSTSLVAQAVESSTDSSDAVEAASLMRGLHALRAEAVEGFHCDASPDITTTTVCGKSLPATVHLEWTDCAPPSRPQAGKPGTNTGSSTSDAVVAALGGGKDSGGKGGGSGGGKAPPAGGGSGGGKAPPAGGGQEGGGPRFGPSSGKVDIAYTYTTAEDCSGAVTQNQKVTFERSRTDEDGVVSKEQGSTTSSALLVAGAPPQKKATSADVTRTLTDAAGTVVSSVHLKGAQTVDFSTDTPPVRTLNGSYSEDFLDGSKGTVTLAQIVRPSRDVCPWPTSGTLTRTSSDNTSHTLAFGPECGAATLDGTAVDLSTQRLPDRGHH